MPTSSDAQGVEQVADGMQKPPAYPAFHEDRMQDGTVVG